MRWLTGLAIVFWMAAFLAGAGVLVFHSVFLKPKEQQIMADYQQFGHLARHTNQTGVYINEKGELAEPVQKLTPEEALNLHFTMSYVVTRGVLAVAISVIILSCGTLATLLLVVMNRRMTLNQINHSLAKISEQISQMQARAAP